MFTCRADKGGELSSQASKMLYKPPGTVNITRIRNRSTNQIAENSLFNYEIILINIRKQETRTKDAEYFKWFVR